MKVVVVLEFSGFVFLPVEITVYDHTLQCAHSEWKGKCANIGYLDFGYLRTATAKSQTIQVLNRNPILKEVKIWVDNGTMFGVDVNATVTQVAQ